MLSIKLAAEGETTEDLVVALWNTITDIRAGKTSAGKGRKDHCKFTVESAFAAGLDDLLKEILMLNGL